MVAAAPVTLAVTSISINPKTDPRKLEEPLKMLTLCVAALPISTS